MTNKKIKENKFNLIAFLFWHINLFYHVRSLEWMPPLITFPWGLKGRTILTASLYLLWLIRFSLFRLRLNFCWFYYYYFFCSLTSTLLLFGISGVGFHRSLVLSLFPAMYIMYYSTTISQLCNRSMLSAQGIKQGDKIKCSHECLLLCFP